MGRDVQPASRRDRDWARRLTSFFTRAKAYDVTPCRGTSSRGSKERLAVQEASILGVASGKGGTGKSFLSTSLAVALSQDRCRVALVDCDFGLANDHLLLGVNPDVSIQHLFAGTASLREILVRTKFGPNLLPGGSGISRLGDLSEAEMLQFSAALAQVAATEDVVLLDAAAGISPQCLLTLLAAQCVIVVTNPEIAALTDAYALIKCLAQQRADLDVAVVVNRVTGPGQGRTIFEKLAGVSRRFCECELHYLGAVPEEPAVSHHRLNQPPLVISDPECPASQAIFRILDRLGELMPLVSRRVPSQETVDARMRAWLSRPLRGG